MSGVETAVADQSLQRGFSAEDVDAFRQHGYVIARNLACESVCQTMQDVTEDGLSRRIGPWELEADLRYPGAPPSRKSPGGETVRRLNQAISRHPIFTEWVSCPPVLNRLRQLIGPDVVMPLAHHNCIMTKQPQFSSDTGWHQDIRYWSFGQPELVSVWLALGREDPENGCLQLIPGTHQSAFRREQLDDKLFLRTDLPENRRLIERRIDAELQPGDVLFFHARTFHAADRNRSDSAKFSVVFTFRPWGNRPLPGTRSASLPELLFASES